MSKLYELFCDICNGTGIDNKGAIKFSSDISAPTYTPCECSVCNGSGYSKDKVFALFLESPEESVAGKRIVGAMKDTKGISVNHDLTNESIAYSHGAMQFYHNSIHGNRFFTSLSEALTSLLEEKE